MISEELLKELEVYEEFSNKISEEIEMLKNMNGNDNIELLEEVIMENMGFYTMNATIIDVEGGRVQTKHNMQKKIYANENMKYKRSDYEDKKEMNEFKKKSANEDGNFTCAYSGIDTKNIHVDHIVSANEFHKDYGFALNEKDKKKIINQDDNFAMARGDINISKGKQSLQDWKSGLNGGRDIKNEDYFGYNSEVAKEVELKDEKKRNSLGQDRNKSLGKFYLKESINNGLQKGGEMAIKIGITEAVGISTREFFIFIKEKSQKRDSLADIISDITKGLKIAFLKIFSETKEILKKIIKSFKNGLLETVVTTIINIFVTTSTNIVKSIRDILNIILNVKNSYNNLACGEKRKKTKEILSLIMKGLLSLPIFNGLGVTNGIESILLKIGVPNILSDALALGISSILGAALIFITGNLLKKFKIIYNEKVANNMQIFNSGLNSNIACAKAILSNMELEQIMQTGKAYLKEITKERKIYDFLLNKEFEKSREISEKLSNLKFLPNFKHILDEVEIESRKNEKTLILNELWLEVPKL